MPTMTYPLVVAPDEMLALAETVRTLAAYPVLRSVLVAPDVFDRLRDALPVARPGSCFDLLGVRVDVLHELPAGTMIPLDQHGRPMAKPTREVPR